MDDIKKELEPKSESIKESVGEEFVNWAEKHWDLHEKYHKKINPNNPIAESCPYDYIRDTFIKKINDTIICRLNGE